MQDLNTSVQYVKGVGPRLADVLGAKGIHTSITCSTTSPSATKTD